MTPFDYQDADGVTVCRKVRIDLPDGGKTFMWERPDGNGGWLKGQAGLEPPLYRLPDLISAPVGEVVYAVEGERKADKLASWGLVATSIKDLPGDLSVLRDRTVVILPDNDEPGAGYASDFREALAGVAARVDTIDLPGLPPKGDIIDWTGSKDELALMVAKVLAEPPAAPQAPRTPRPDRHGGDVEPPSEREVEDLRQALDSIPAEDRKVWTDVGMRLAAAGDVGRELFEEWSETSDKFRHEDDMATFDGFSPTDCHWRGVFAIAAAHGWENPGPQRDPDEVLGVPPSAEDIAATIAASEKAAADLLVRIQAERAARSSFGFVAVGALELKAPEFLVDGLIETDTLGAIYGDPKTGKSFVAVDLALCVATGESFHGREVMKPGPVFYIAGEGHNGLARRFRAWGMHRGVSIDDVPLFKSDRAAQFLDDANAKAVTDAVAVLAEAHGAPALIVIDTLARNFGPGDENDNANMGVFVAALDDMRARWPGCAVVVVHHTGHSDKGRMRGGSALGGAVDFGYLVAKKSTGVLEVANPLMKEAELNDPMLFVLESVDLGIVDHKGRLVTSAVLVPTEAIITEPKLTSKETEAMDVLLAMDNVSLGVSRADFKRALEESETLDRNKPAAARSGLSRYVKVLKEKGFIDVEGDSIQLAKQSETMG